MTTKEMLKKMFLERVVSKVWTLLRYLVVAGVLQAIMQRRGGGRWRNVDAEPPAGQPAAPAGAEP